MAPAINSLELNAKKNINKHGTSNSMQAAHVPYCLSEPDILGKELPWAAISVLFGGFVGGLSGSKDRDGPSSWITVERVVLFILQDI